MKTRITIIVGLFFILCSLKSAGQNAGMQNDTSKYQQPSATAQSAYSEKLAFKLDYFGELVLHPGLSM